MTTGEMRELGVLRGLEEMLREHRVRVCAPSDIAERMVAIFGVLDTLRRIEKEKRP